MAYTDVRHARATPCPSPSVKLVLMTLASYRNGIPGHEKFDQCNPSVATLVKDTGCGRSTVLRALRILIDEMKVVKVVGTGEKGNHFYGFNWKVVPINQSNSGTGPAVGPVPLLDHDRSHGETPPVPLLDVTGPAVGPKGGRRESEGEGGRIPPPPGTADEIRKRINRCFGVQESTVWKHTDCVALMEFIAWPKENWDLIERYMLAPKPRTSRADDRDNPLHRRPEKLHFFLQDLTDVLIQATRWDKSLPTPGRATSAPDPLAQPPADDWRALADELYERPEVTAGRQWPDLDRDVRSEIHEFAAKKNREKKTGENAA